MGKYIYITNLNNFPSCHNYLFHKANRNVIEKLNGQQERFVQHQLLILEVKMKEFPGEYSEKLNYNRVAALVVTYL